eukprot:XP_011678288.1 PREDICTED: uncharacterized protein LOC105444995 isoform X2 [Strongylocentrotus purpuratus]
MNDTTKPSPVAMTELSFKMTILRAFTLQLVLSFAASELQVTNVDCGDDVSFTSPNYPLHYPNRANENRFIMAPNRRRILVTFADFIVEEDDFLDLDDTVDKQNSKRYTGEIVKFPPFLTKGNELEMTFISLKSGTRKGFNVLTSCYNHSNVARIVGGSSPGKGFLELRTQSNNWRRVSKDGFDERMAEVVCGELGYPAVRKVSYGTDECISAGQDCIKAPICNEYTFRLEDCSWPFGNFTSGDAVKVECYEPGYKGCFDPEDLPQQNRFIFESTSQCVSSCRAITRKGLAIMNGKQCFCSIADDVRLPDIAPVADDSTCIQNTRGTRQVINSLVYDVSVGFCDELDDVIHGSWDSNVTWFGSIVHLTCDDGYRLNGGGTLLCIPGLSPYYPVWNDSGPTCDMLEGPKWFSTTPNTEVCRNTSSATGTLIPDEFSGQKKLFFLLLIVLFIGLILGVVVLWKRSGKKSFISRTRSWITNSLDRLWYQSENEMVPTKPENPQPLTADGRESPSGTRTQPSNDGRSGIHLTVTMNTEDSLINTTLFNDGESQPHIFHTQAQHAQDNIDSSQPSNTTIILFPSLQQPIPHRENPYQIEESESNTYYSTMDSGVSNENNTMQINTNIGMDENTYEAENSQENIQDQKQTSDYRTEIRSMSNRPLPHRPISYGVHEGPSLPPRTNLETRPLNMGQNTCTRFDDTCHTICALDYTTLPNDYPLGLSVTSKTHTLHHNISSHDKDQTTGKGTRAQKGGDDYPCTGATSRASDNHGYYSVDDLEDEGGFNGKSVQPQFSKPDPFYHCLEDDQQIGRDREDLLKSESENGDLSHTDMMVENILYYPLSIQTGDVR